MCDKPKHFLAARSYEVLPYDSPQKAEMKRPAQAEHQLLISAYEADEAIITEFKKSMWFTRGWTLEELLAPSIIPFLNYNWRPFGTQGSLADRIALENKTPQKALESDEKVKACCAPQKMSWASHRETSRVEDITYCLLGLFDVNMPLLYGEGSQTFRRL
jgi:hypothetical protein